MFHTTNTSCDSFSVSRPNCLELTGLYV